MILKVTEPHEKTPNIDDGNISVGKVISSQLLQLRRQERGKWPNINRTVYRGKQEWRKRKRGI